MDLIETIALGILLGYFVIKVIEAMQSDFRKRFFSRDET